MMFQTVAAYLLSLRASAAKVKEHPRVVKGLTKTKTKTMNFMFYV